MTTKILLLVPGAYTNSGGIQTYGRELIEALQAHPAVALDCVSKNDRAENLPEHLRERMCGTGSYTGIWRTLAFCYGATKITWMKRPDIIISLLTSFSPLQAFLKRISGARTILVGHGIEVWNLKKKSHIQMWKQLSTGVPVSSYTRDSLVSQGVLELNRSVIIPSCFHEDRYTIAEVPKDFFERYGIPEHARIILSVARVDVGEGYKGCDSVLDAVKVLLQKDPSLYYLHVGTGSDLERLRKRVEDENLSSHAQFCGFVPDEDMNHFFNASSVYCMPSTGEGFGIVYLEALACGKPVIIANTGGCTDLLNKGLPVFAVVPGTIEELSKELERVLALHDTFDGAQIRSLVCRLYGRERFASQWYSTLALESV